MNNAEILSHVDHTLLQATASWSEIQALCDEAVANQTASVCVPPSYIKRIADTYGDKLNICTVIGFPLGYQTTAVKVLETKEAIADGAAEVDMVINLGDVKNGDFDLITAEIKALKQAVGQNILKVIIETCYLTETEKIRLCQCVTEAGADYIKTSTGFGTAGAKIEDIRLFKQHIGAAVKMKAAGGVRTREDLEMFLAEGCERIGTSSALKILQTQA
jgi:deoxyribose-phosphate aldolase